MNRKKFVVANWKMNKTPKEAEEFLNKIKDKIDSNINDVCLCIPSIDLHIANEILKNSKVSIGAENFYYEDKGAFTGEISAKMLLHYNVKYVIIGHSERRNIFKEDYELINKKVLKALAENINPIICIGESLQQRNDNKTNEFLKEEIIEALKNVKAEDMKKITIAYEPIWAIGTGRTALPEDAENVCKYVRSLIKDLYNIDIANEIRILYGGSVNKSNVKQLFSKENIDGGLIGGASLTEEFIDLVNYQDL